MQRRLDGFLLKSSSTSPRWKIVGRDETDLDLLTACISPQPRAPGRGLAVTEFQQVARLNELKGKEEGPCACAMGSAAGY